MRLFSLAIALAIGSGGAALLRGAADPVPPVVKAMIRSTPKPFESGHGSSVIILTEPPQFRGDSLRIPEFRPPVSYGSC